MKKFFFLLSLASALYGGIIINPGGGGGGGGSGTVTSVAMTVPAFLQVSGSPITTNGTLAVSLSGTALPLANGGTGQTTKAAAFDALSPMSASGDIIYGGTSGTGTRLGKGSDGNVLTLASGLPSWAAPASGGITTLAAIGSSPNANGATISSVTLNLEPASASFGGVMTTGTQTVAGQKTFSTGVTTPKVTFTGSASNFIDGSSGSEVDIKSIGTVKIQGDNQSFGYLFNFSKMSMPDTSFGNSINFPISQTGNSGGEWPLTNIGFIPDDLRMRRPWNVLVRQRLQVGIPQAGNGDGAPSWFGPAVLTTQVPPDYTTQQTTSANASTTINISGGVGDSSLVQETFTVGDYVKLAGLSTIAKITAVGSSSQFTVDTALGDNTTRVISIIGGDPFAIRTQGSVTIHGVDRLGRFGVWSGSNKSTGVATLVGGTVTVSNTLVTATSKIFVSCETPAGVQGVLSAPIASIVAGTSFVINSSNVADTSTVNWWIVETL